MYGDRYIKRFSTEHTFPVLDTGVLNFQDFLAL